jgi:hypothetical protein
MPGFPSPARSTRSRSAPTALSFDENAYAEHAVCAADGEMVRAAYALHPEDDDFGQANTLVNDVMDDAALDRLVETVRAFWGSFAVSTCVNARSTTGATSTRQSARKSKQRRTWSSRPNDRETK